MLTANNSRVFLFRGLKDEMNIKEKYPLNFNLIGNGSRYFAMDTDEMFIFDEESQTWTKITSSGGGGGGGSIPIDGGEIPDMEEVDGGEIEG